MLVAGSVIIGRREEGQDVGAAGTAGAESTVAVSLQDGFRDEPDAPLAGVGSASGDEFRDSIELDRKPKKQTRGSTSDED